MDSRIELLISEVQKRPILWNKWSPLYKNRLHADKEWASIANKLNENKDALKTKWKNLRDVFQKELKKIKMPRSGDPGNTNIDNYTGKWSYFKAMLFLKDSLLPRTTENNFSQPQIVSENESQIFITETEVTDNTFSNQHTEDQDITQCNFDAGASETHDRPPSMLSSHSEQSTDLTEKPPSLLSTVKISTKKRKRECEITPFEKAMLLTEEKKNAAFTNRVSAEDPDMYFLKSLLPFFKELNSHKKLLVRSQIQNVLAEALSPNSRLASYQPPAQQPHGSSRRIQHSLMTLPVEQSHAPSPIQHSVASSPGIQSYATSPIDESQLSSSSDQHSFAPDPCHDSYTVVGTYGSPPPAFGTFGDSLDSKATDY